MQRIIYLFFFLSVGYSTFAQDSLPTIKATSDKVDFKVGDDFFAKGWILEPDKKPDVFSVGSKWLYNTKKITFTTDIDSISFNVQPGKKYNFIIVLNEKTPCYIQIVTLANPVFMSKNIMIPVLAGLIVILLLLYFNRNKINAVNLLYFGYAATLLFWLITFVSGFVHGNYNHFKNVISELGAIGTKSEILTSASLVVLSVLCILFSIGFYKASKKLRLSVIPAILTFSMPITILWAAIFPLGNAFHGSTGALPFLTIIGCLLSGILWKPNKQFLELRLFSLFGFFIMMLILLRFIQPFGHQFEGLIQRFYYLGWTIWTVAISYYFTKKLREQFNAILSSNQKVWLTLMPGVTPLKKLLK